MSGSAAPKSTKGKKCKKGKETFEQTFEPDFQAKEVRETDNTWFQKRFGTENDDKIVAGATGKASKSGGSGQKKPTKKTRESKCIAS